MNHPVVIQDGETLANITIVRNNGMYGAEVIVDEQLVCIAPQFSTVDGLFHVLQGRIVEVLLRSSARRWQGERPAGNGG